MTKTLKKYVLTGAPCTGKTTILKALGEFGYQIVPEASTILLKDRLKKKLPLLDNDANSFQKLLLQKQLSLEAKLKNWPLAFIDRGIIDGIAYCKLFKIKPPQELIVRVRQHKYNEIFRIDFLPFFSNDNVRRESLDVAKHIHFLIKETYEEYGYKVIDVPFLSVSKRIKFILKKIKSSESNFENLYFIKKTFKKKNFEKNLN